MTLHQFPKVDQGTDEWHDLRRGIVTASVVGKLLTVEAPGAMHYGCPECGVTSDEPCMSLRSGTPIKNPHAGRSALAETHAATAPPVIKVANTETSRGVTATLIAERITGWTEDTPMTSDMWRGVECEPIARDIYSGHYHQAVEIGFMRREEDGWTLGYSPDGLVGTDGLIEIKSPRAKTHLRTILADEVPAYYMPQLQAGLLVSGRDWIDFVSYVGGMPLFVKRVLPDPAWFDAITAACIAFEVNAAEMVGRYEAATTNLPKTERPTFDIQVA